MAQRSDSTFEGSEFVSTIANTGIPRRLASRTAMFSFPFVWEEKFLRLKNQYLSPLLEGIEAI